MYNHTQSSKEARMCIIEVHTDQPISYTCKYTSVVYLRSGHIISITYSQEGGEKLYVRAGNALKFFEVLKKRKN